MVRNLRSRDEWLLGFDARWVREMDAAQWDEPRRRTYLLRHDIRHVISTDGMVCPSFFRQHLPSGLPPELLATIDQSGPLAPEWVGANSPFWEDLGLLKEHLRHVPPDGNLWIIAATCIIPEAIRVTLKYGPYPEPTRPAKRDKAWTFLGYDVSDVSALSGLTNCGYTDEEFHDLPREKWAAMLNENHLFRDLADAQSFREFTDRRVPEHAPFLVYGLYRVGVMGFERVGWSERICRHLKFLEASRWKAFRRREDAHALP